MQFGTSLAAVVASEDVQAALFLRTLPEVDERCVASLGFSIRRLPCLASCCTYRGSLSIGGS